MDDQSTKSSNCVTVEIYPHLKQDDFDLLILFLESKRQSGGGDISNVDDLTFANVQNGKILRIFYQDSEVTKRVISKKFLKFKNYHIRTLPGSISSFKCENYDILTDKLIIKNICVDNDDDESIVEMYAEYLAPYNEVTNLQKSSLSYNTFIATFNSKLDRESLYARFSKKKILRKKEIVLMDPFNTKSFLIFSPKKQDTDFGHLIDKLNSELANFEKSNPYFIETNSYSLLVQFDNEKLLNEIFNIFELYFKSTSLDLIIEKVYNFSLVDRFSAKNQIVHKPLLDRTFVEVAVQTDFLPESNSKGVESVSNTDSKEPSKLNSTAKSNLPFDADTKPEQLIEFNIEDIYTTALLNVKQLFFNFQEELTKINPKLELINSNGRLFLKNSSLTDNNSLKTKTLTALIFFFEKKAFHKIIEIPARILKSPDLMSKIDSKVQEYNKLCPALYFRIQNQQLEGFGCKKILQNKSNELSRFIDVLSSHSNSNLATVETKPSENSIKISISPDSLAFKVLWNIKNIFFDFKNSVKSIGADLRIEQDQKLSLFNMDSSNSVWEAKVKDYLEEFEKKQVKTIKLGVPENLRNKINIDIIKFELKEQEKSLVSIKVELVENEIVAFGYCKAVDIFTRNINKKLKYYQNNSEKNFANKLLVVINRVKSVEYKILQGFNGKYFKEFSDNLNQIQAILTAYYKNETDNGFKIFCNLEKSEQQDLNKVNIWHQRVLECRKNFFNKFTRQAVQLPHGKTAPSKVDFDPEKIIIEWKSGTQADIIGEKNEVERVKNNLVKKEKLPESSDLSSSQFNFSKPNENTFLISDLKWFQIRILFEEQFFKHLSDNYKDLNVMLDTQLTRICLSGNKKEINKAKKMAFKILEKILGAEIECDSATLDQMQKNENQFLSYLKDQNLKCVVDTKSNTDKFIVYSTRLEDIEKFKSIFSNFKF